MKKNVQKESLRRSYTKAMKEFTEKYGFFGEKLETEEEKEKKKKIRRASGAFHERGSEYAAIDKLYHDEEKRIDEYREKCKDEVFDLMKKYFSRCGIEGEK